MKDFWQWSVIDYINISNDLNFTPIHKHTLQSIANENVFVINIETNVFSLSLD